MKAILIAAVLAIAAIASTHPASAEMCFTNCYGNTCTMNCY